LFAGFLLEFGLMVYSSVIKLRYEDKQWRYKITQDMEPNNIDLTFIDIISKNLIQEGCRSGITSDSSNR
jgi:hypothetical protein